MIDRNGYDEARKLATDLCDKGISQGDPVLEARGLVRLAYIEILFGKWGNKWKDKLERARKIMSDDQSIAKAELLMFSGHKSFATYGRFGESVLLSV